MTTNIKTCLTIPWITNAFWAILVLALLWIIESQLFAHRAYIANRDMKWEAFDKRVEANQHRLIKHVTEHENHMESDSRQLDRIEKILNAIYQKNKSLE